MKNKILFSLIGVSFYTIPAFSDLNCSTQNGDAQLRLHPVVNQRLNAQVSLVQDDQEIVFGALKLPSTVSGPLFKIEEYKLFGYLQPKTHLTIVSRTSFGRGGCGRGTCEFGGNKVITAKLVQDTNETKFNCYEEID